MKNDIPPIAGFDVSLQRITVSLLFLIPSVFTNFSKIELIKIEKTKQAVKKITYSKRI